MEIAVSVSREESQLRKIFENIIFLADVFAEMADGEKQDVLFLALAKSFELKSREGVSVVPFSEGVGEAGLIRNRWRSAPPTLKLT